MKDILGQELEIGDNIVMTDNWQNSKTLIQTKIIGFGNKGIFKGMVITNHGNKQPLNTIKINKLL